MGVGITIKWNFLGDEEHSQVVYSTPVPLVDAPRVEPKKGGLYTTTVLPLNSSVLAPGLSMPIPAR